jgi:hypothetical protein
MSRRIAIALWAASIAAAVMIARPSAERVTAPAAPTREVAREARVIAPPADRLSREDVRRAVREEMAAAARTPAPAGDEIVDDANEVVAEARTIVRGAIDAGRWTDASRDQLRARMVFVPRAELDAMLSELFVAFNAGHVRADVRGPLL